jgi:hypothetical protein
MKLSVKKSTYVPIATHTHVPTKHLRQLWDKMFKNNTDDDHI